MKENHEYRTRLDDIIEDIPEFQQSDNQENANSSISNKKEILHLEWLDGTKQTLYYRNLNRLCLEIDDNENIITGYFGGHQLTIKGYRLDSLYNKLANHGINRIAQQESRYAALNDNSAPVVEAMNVIMA